MNLLLVFWYFPVVYKANCNFECQNLKRFSFFLKVILTAQPAGSSGFNYCGVETKEGRVCHIHDQTGSLQGSPVHSMAGMPCWSG